MGLQLLLTADNEAGSGRRPKWGVWLIAALVLILGVGVVLTTWVLRSHPSDQNPWLHLPGSKDPTAKVSAGEDCGSYRPPQGMRGDVDAGESKVVVNRGSMNCGEATRVIDAALSQSTKTGTDFPIDDGWSCVTFDGPNAALSGYKVKCQKRETEVRLVFVMDRDASNVVDNRLYRLPTGAPGTDGPAYSFSPPDRNIWCQINMNTSGTVKDIICQGALPPDAPLVDGAKPNSVVLSTDPSARGARFAVLDSRIVDFVPPLQPGETIHVLAVECTATGADELTCTANRGGAAEHGFTISSRAFEFH
ncbi:hypothetical protein MAUB1S_02481 [Mycolicibacterium aubagnense]